MMYISLKKFVIYMLIGCLFSTVAYSHGGGLDSQGCHRQTSTGTRHCHNQKANSNPNSDNSESNDRLIAFTLGLLIGGVIFYKVGYEIGNSIASSYFVDTKEARFYPVFDLKDGEVSAGFEFRF